MYCKLLTFVIMYRELAVSSNRYYLPIIVPKYKLRTVTSITVVSTLLSWNQLYSIRLSSFPIQLSSSLSSSTESIPYFIVSIVFDFYTLLLLPSFALFSTCAQTVKSKANETPYAIGIPPNRKTAFFLVACSLPFFSLYEHCQSNKQSVSVHKT